jgi:RHS repeat-associated protein
LGNVRLSYFKNANGSAEVLEKNDYYPFGLKHNANVISFGDSSYSYQYNGKEYQKETGWSDYGARMYMPDIARWGVIDPLAETSRRFNPYNYAYNNPISFIDPDGRKALAVDEGWSWNVSTSSGWFNERRNFGSFEEFIQLTSGNEREKGSGGASLEGTEATYDEALEFLGLKQPEYFKGIDFSQFGNEPPVDLFGLSAGKYSAFHQVPENFKYVKGDGIFTVFAHANSRGVQYYDGSGNVRLASTVEEFDQVMSSRSNEWQQARKEGKPITLIFFACNVASETYQSHDGRMITQSTTFAEKFSRLPNMTVIAPDGYVHYGWRNNKAGLTGISNYRDDGGFLTFRNGEQIFGKRDLKTILFISQINAVLRQK